MLDDIVISNAILKKGMEKFREATESDVIIAGAGPSGLTAACYLAKSDIKVTVFERALKPGGGMPGGGIGLPVIVVQDEGLEILREFDIEFEKSEWEGYYIADSLESTARLTAEAISAGTILLNLTTVEDVIVKNGRVEGVVVNRTPIEMAGLHVDPVSAKSRFVVDATGHDTDVVNKLVKRKDIRIDTPSGRVEGEGPMWAEEGEKSILANTREVFPNLYVTGMAANAVAGSPRMGPVFGGMLLSGKKVAGLIKDRL